MTDSQQHILRTKSKPIAVNVLLVWILHHEAGEGILLNLWRRNEIRIHVFTVHPSISINMLMTVGSASCATILEYFTEGFVHSGTPYFKIFDLMFLVLLARSISQLVTFVFRPSHQL
jgi:hypothetical protein